jgi:hypothetical protein
LFGVAVGIAGKVIYDRRFAKRPDLRYVFGAPAKFGDKVYQNLEVTNAGTETTTDVRINFSLPNFDLSEHQVSYEGPHNFERMNDQVGMLIASLPPGDSVTLSFVFSPSKSNIGKIQDLFLSAKSKECVAKPLERTKPAGNDWTMVAPGLIVVAAAVMAGWTLASTLWQTKSVQQMSEPLILSEKLRVIEKIEKTPNEIARLIVQVANPVVPGKDAEVECYIDNMSDHPLTGYLTIFAPSWAGPSNIEKINVGAKTRNLVRRKLKVPNVLPPGKYNIAIELSGAAFDQPVSLRSTGIIEVKL